MIVVSYLRQLLALDSRVDALEVAPGGGGLLAFSKKRNASGTSYSLNNSSWTDLDNTFFDTAIAASAGDIISLTVDAYWEAEAPNGALDAASIVSSSPVNYVSGGNSGTNFGVLQWGSVGSGNSGFKGGTVLYQVQAGDLSAGLLTLRLRYRTSGARTLYKNANTPLTFTVTNLGPVGS